MYVCMYIRACVDVCIDIYERASVRLRCIPQGLQGFLHIYAYVCVCVYIYININRRARGGSAFLMGCKVSYTCIYVYVCVHIYMYTYTCIYIYICLCTHIYICRYIHLFASARQRCTPRILQGLFYMYFACTQGSFDYP